MRITTTDLRATYKEAYAIVDELIELVDKLPMLDEVEAMKAAGALKGDSRHGSK